MTRSNEFTGSLDDNRIRPYNVGITRHEETISTIVLYTDNEKVNASGSKKDFLSPSQLTTAIPPLVSEAASSDVLSERRTRALTNGYPDLPNGSIPKLSLDETNPYYGVFNNFSLLSVREVSEQIIKLHVNFGSDWNAFFFGEQPKIYQFNGFFIDSRNYPYYQEFMVAYEKFLAGRKAIENRIQTTFVYDGKIVDGYMMGITTNSTAADQLVKNFQFTVLVKGFSWIRSNIIAKQISNTGRFKLQESFNGMTNVGRIRLQENRSEISEGNGFGKNDDEVGYQTPTRSGQ